MIISAAAKELTGEVSVRNNHASPPFLLLPSLAPAAEDYHSFSPPELETNIITPSSALTETAIDLISVRRDEPHARRSRRAAKPGSVR